jgi:hypothetical protein
MLTSAYIELYSLFSYLVDAILNHLIFLCIKPHQVGHN